MPVLSAKLAASTPTLFIICTNKLDTGVFASAAKCLPPRIPPAAAIAKGIFTGLTPARASDTVKSQ